MDTSDCHKQDCQMLLTIAGHYEHNGSIGDTHATGSPRLLFYPINYITRNESFLLAVDKVYKMYLFTPTLSSHILWKRLFIRIPTTKQGTTSYSFTHV